MIRPEKANSEGVGSGCGPRADRAKEGAKMKQNIHRVAKSVKFWNFTLQTKF